MRPVVAAAFACLLAPPVAAQEAVPVLPDLSKTPGAINPALNQDKVCDAKFSTKPYRKGSKSDRKCVRARYGDPTYRFTFDHLVPLELGGEDSCDNLWPQPLAEDAKKDKLEHALNTHVCYCRDLNLEQAQTLIRTNWIAAYAKYVTPKGAKACDVNAAPGM